jgi:hypothetical protein
LVYLLNCTVRGRAKGGYREAAKVTQCGVFHQSGIHGCQSSHHKQINHSPLPGIIEQDTYWRFLDVVTLSSEQLHVEGEGKLLTSTKLATVDCLLEFVWNFSRLDVKEV